MSKVRFVAPLGLAMMLCAESFLYAQTAVPPAAPLPAQILSAKKVFISNASAEFTSDSWSGGMDRTYNEFYAATKNWGRYELVQTPGDADIVFEISLTVGQPYSSFKLRLLDPKTNVVLWTIIEYFPQTATKNTRDKKFDGGIDAVVGDLKALVSGPAVAAQ
jgi:hypothetical protein